MNSSSSKRRERICFAQFRGSANHSLASIRLCSQSQSIDSSRSSFWTLTFASLGVRCNRLHSVRCYRLHSVRCYRQVDKGSSTRVVHERRSGDGDAGLTRVRPYLRLDCAGLTPFENGHRRNTFSTPPFLIHLMIFLPGRQVGGAVCPPFQSPLLPRVPLPLSSVSDPSGHLCSGPPYNL